MLELCSGGTLNKNPIPNDPRSSFVTGAVRIGTPSVTTAGMREPELAEIARLLGRALRRRSGEADVQAVRRAGQRGHRPRVGSRLGWERPSPG